MTYIHTYIHTADARTWLHAGRRGVPSGQAWSVGVRVLTNGLQDEGRERGVRVHHARVRLVCESEPVPSCPRVSHPSVVE
eukprot:63519-Prymnesium_polylepis.1